MAEQNPKQWTVRKTATVSFVVGALIWLVGWTLEPIKTSALAGVGYWALQSLVPVLTTILISFIFLGRHRPERLQALKGAALGAAAGPIVEIVLKLVLLFIPVLGWIAIPFVGLVGRFASAYLSAAGTMLGELKEEAK